MVEEGYTIALMQGPAPSPGASKHQGVLLAVDGQTSSAFDPDGTVQLDDALLPSDIIVPLADQSLTASGLNPKGPLWLLLRVRSETVGAQILVIEDSEANGLYYTEVLEAAGAHVVLAPDGATGLEHATTGNFDLALVDVRLPDSNGYEISRLLSTVESGWSAPILLMSADATMLNARQVRDVGAAGFVVNPVKPDELIAAATSAMRRHRPSLAKQAEASDDTEPDFLLRLAGRPSAATTDGWVELAAGRSTDILATLAASCPLPLASEQLSQLIWDEDLTVSANALYTAVSRLRRQLDGTRLAGAIVTEDDGYRLEIPPETIDLVDFERTAQQALRNRHDASIEELTALVDTWSGDLFPVHSNRLLSNWKNRLQELRSQVQELLTVKLAVAGQAADATRICRDLVLEEPWRESAWSLLIVCLYRTGRTNDAVQAFRMATKQLRDELGLDPGPGLSRLESMVLNHSEDLLDNDWFQSLTGTLNRQ